MLWIYCLWEGWSSFTHPSCPWPRGTVFPSHRKQGHWEHLGWLQCWSGVVRGFFVCLFLKRSKCSRGLPACLTRKTVPAQGSRPAGREWKAGRGTCAGAALRKWMKGSEQQEVRTGLDTCSCVPSVLIWLFLFCLCTFKKPSYFETYKNLQE